MFKTNTVKFFIYCALIFGILLITIIPPFQSPDEDSHFKRAYVISKGKIFPTSQNGKIGFEIPDEIVDYINEKMTFMGDRDKKYNYSEEILDDKLPKDYSKVSFHNFSTVDASPVAYVAPAVGIIFAKITTRIIGLHNISVVVMLHFARLFSLLLYVFLVSLAIKITPILKKTLCIIGLLPMSLALAVAISYDSILIALSILSTAVIFKLIFDENVKKISYKYLIFFGIVAFILLAIKTVYVTVLMPLIFIPKEKFEGKLSKMVKFFGIIVAIALFLYIINKIPLMTLQKNSTQDYAGKQISFIISNPIKYLKIWIKTMIQNRNFYISGAIGTFGLLDTYIPAIYLVGYIASAFMIILADLSVCNIKFNLKYKAISVLGSLATVFAIFLGLYIFWTSMEVGIGTETITGVQGRYFIPIIPLAIILFSNSILEKNKTIKLYMEKVLNNYYLIPSTMLCIMLLTIFLRFWC